MTRFIVAALVILVPAVLAESTDKGRSVPLIGSVAATGASGANYGQQSTSSETHDKKNFGVNFSSDKGSTNQYSNTGLQAAASGGVAQAQVPQLPPVQYPIYQYQYPFPYPYYGYPYGQYPQVYPNGGVPNYVGHNVPNLGVGSSVQLPNVAASSGGVVQGQVPNIRY